MYLLCFKVYKEDLPQLKQQSKEKNHAVPFLKREKAPEDSLKLQFIHGWVPVTSLSIRLRMSPFSMHSHLRRALLSSLHLPVINILTISLCPVSSVGVLRPSQCVCLDFFILYILPRCIYYCSLLLFHFIISLHHLWFLCSHNSCSVLLGSS